MSRGPGYETVTVVRPGGTDRYGDPLPAVEHDERFCVVAPRGALSSETTFQSDQIIVGWTVYAPPGADIRATDQLRVRGVLCDVTGEPALWQQPGSHRADGLQVAAQRVSG